MDPRTDRHNVHGTALRLGASGLLIRGPSGAGKSLLALQLIADYGALLVADDRVDLDRQGESLLMDCPPLLVGRIELRGRGILRRPAVGATRLDLVVDLVDMLERMPEPVAFVTELMGVTLPRCPVPRRGVVDSAHQILLLREAVHGLVHPE